ncbi:MAG: DUF4398 domain-containing protein [Deltaproteobacteria bacterium]|nr:DUF4398 domain-containing protein [Deltaproteobacteria bacterium]MCB9479564.1 DUF4398 domain-containing protein [Deltaproteobacteria bacterium]MCB9488406.1 DUF4398 domain-containing protein [Deltaproteobacteria bacterium]
MLTTAMLLVGCAAKQDIASAERAVAVARETHADYLAPYAFHSAELYLNEAHERLNDSDFDLASKYALLATARAKEAETAALKEIALRGTDTTPPRAGASR